MLVNGAGYSCKAGFTSSAALSTYWWQFTPVTWYRTRVFHLRYMCPRKTRNRHRIMPERQTQLHVERLVKCVPGPSNVRPDARFLALVHVIGSARISGF
ncbi:hypothetical protein Hanom_Chr07g00583171 [Helianthus anomalus]